MSCISQIMNLVIKEANDSFVVKFNNIEDCKKWLAPILRDEVIFNPSDNTKHHSYNGYADCFSLTNNSTSFCTDRNGQNDCIWSKNFSLYLMRDYTEEENVYVFSVNDQLESCIPNLPNLFGFAIVCNGKFIDECEICAQ